MRGRVLAAGLLLAPAAGVRGDGAPGEVRVLAVAPAEVAAWDARVASLLRSGELRPRQLRADPLVPGRRHQRLEQVFKGVPVFGGEIVRQANALGAVSLFGALHQGIDLDTRPALGPEEARASVERALGARVGRRERPELLVLPERDGYALVYRLKAWTGADLRWCFVDARTGALRLTLRALRTDAAVGLGRGVLNQPQKVSAEAQAGAFVLSDALRPPSLRTYDMDGDLARTVDVLLGDVELLDSDLARDADNDWTGNGAAVDAHAYAGFVYDYYFKRHGRRGLDDAEIGIRSLVHPARRGDERFYSERLVGLFYTNAFYAGNGLMVYGEGGLVSEGREWDYVAGGLDVVGHELTHGVTDFSSRLIYRDESGALDEAFSDIMGTSLEFYCQPRGDGPLRADYLLGEDVVRPGGLRSMANPLAYGDPDHVSKARFLGSDVDGGGVHTNSAIASHAFYLAVEGGRNRTSGRSVRGVGPEHREQIEQAFYRAFVFLLPPSADFHTARVTTLQSARDLFGAGSAAARAIAEAWTAVGVP